jgi:transposase
LLNLATETDIERLRQAALLLEQENTRLFQRLERLAGELREARGDEAQGLQLEIAHLKEQLVSRTKALFGDSSERRPCAEQKANEKKEARGGHGPREQRALPIVEVVHQLDEPDQACPSCGGDLHPMADQFEDDRCGAGIETALGPDKLVAGGRSRSTSPWTWRSRSSPTTSRSSARFARWLATASMWIPRRSGSRPGI